MPVVVECPHCRVPIRIPDRLTGRPFGCPKCGATIETPAPSQPFLQPATPAPVAMAAPTPAVDLWYLQSETGEQYGPVKKADLDVWLSEGRITANSQLLRQGANQWQWAYQVYPQLQAHAPQFGAPVEAVNPLDFARNDYEAKKRAKYGLKKMPKSGVVTAIAVVSYILGSLSLLGGFAVIAMGIYFASNAPVLRQMRVRGEIPNRFPFRTAEEMSAYFLIIGMVAVAIGIAMLAGAMGTQMRAQWGRITLLIVAAAYGLAGIWDLVMLQPSCCVAFGYSLWVFLVLSNRRYAAEFR